MCSKFAQAHLRETNIITVTGFYSNKLIWKDQIIFPEIPLNDYQQYCNPVMPVVGIDDLAMYIPSFISITRILLKQEALILKT